MSINLQENGFGLNIVRITEDNKAEYCAEDYPIGAFISVTFSYETDGIKCSMSIEDDHSLNKLKSDDWLNMLKNNSFLDFGFVYGSHVDNGLVIINSSMQEQEITFKVDGARGGVTEFTVPISKCAWAFQKLAELKQED